MSRTAPPGNLPSNRLATQTSPYLLQHAYNPVDWYPWGNEALELARTTGKPVLLSIGYSACHWCHVMAHESFEDPATAEVMNRLFVNIKVDREERPDLDRIYQIAHQLLTRRAGGWPLTMFLTHDDQRPFFGGTYFPPEPRYGMPGFRALLERVGQYYAEQQPELRAQSVALVEALQSIDSPGEGHAGPLDESPLQLLRQQLEQRFDREHGGWTPAPKFPHSGIVQRLLRHWQASAESPNPDLHALFMATLTLKRMADGGLYDHLGGGFSRYSVDERWEIPHFEKMLYDNGALLSAYADAAAATGDAGFAAVTHETATFLLAQMRSAEGPFFSSFDADSEGHEGTYYLWTPEQFRSVLGAEEAALAGTRFGLDQPANFEGRWHLRAAREISGIASEATWGTDVGTLAARLQQARKALLAERTKRVSPDCDQKILTSWNALAIHGLADAARTLQEDAFATAAADALEYLRCRHWRDGRLLAVSRDGHAHLAAYLDDHALLIDAILALQTVRFDSQALAFACQLADALLEQFEDRENGGFFFTASGHEQLIHRSRSFSDDAIPSGNAIAVAALQKLGWLLGEPRYLVAAERALRASWPQLAATPLAHVHMANALEDHLHPHVFVILRGDQSTINAWRRELQRIWRPLVSIIAVASDCAALPPSLAGKVPREGPVAYLCRGSTCDAPMTDLATVNAALGNPG